MLKNDAISLASEIVNAQNNAHIELINEGVFVCMDTLKGKYRFVRYDEIPLPSGETLGQFIASAKESIANLVHITTEQGLAITSLEERVMLLETNLAKVVDYIDNEGDPFASDTLNTDTITQ